MEAKGKLKIAAAVCTLLAGLSAGAPARIIYVDDDATGANDGSSWITAFVRLQRALAVARSGDEVRVAQGLYRPDQDALVVRGHGTIVEIDPSAGPYVSFRLMSGVTIKGGFAGHRYLGPRPEITWDPNARDVERYKTILSGDLHENDVAAWTAGHPMSEALRKDNSMYVVESRSDADSTAVLDGFTIQAAAEAGMHNWRGGPHVINCTFRRNSSRGYNGGALRCDGGQPTFSNCVFQENAAIEVGGAIYASGARLTLTDCRFISNWAHLGGAICSVDSDLLLTGCTFTENASQRGGAMYHQQGTLTLAHCGFEANMALEQGGAVNLVRQKSASMTDCTFRKNWTPHRGGAISHEGVPLLLAGCAFSGNRATQGGAIHTYGPSPLSPDPRAAGTVMTHCIFTGNRASETGGALWGYRVGFTINNCTFADNWARTAATVGGPAEQTQETVSRVAMENCIVWDGDGMISGPRPAVSSSTRFGADIAIRYSDVQGGWPGEGNIDGDPHFADRGRWVDAANANIPMKADDIDARWIEGDYHLQSLAGRWDPAGGSWVPDAVASPCVDAGDPGVSVGDEPEPNGARINMGVYGGTVEASKSYTGKP